MSFSISSKEDTKAAVLADFKKKLADVLAQQAEHKHDGRIVGQLAETYLDLIADPVEGQQVGLNVNGSLSWRGILDDEKEFTSANINVNSYLTNPVS